jgi:putative transposase
MSQPGVSNYLTGTLRGLECVPLQVGGVEDHVRILCGLSRKISIADSILEGPLPG